MDARELFLLRYDGVRPWITEALLEKLTPEQVRRVPVAGVNSVAWLVWHIARAEDIALNRFVAHRPQLFFEERWGSRLRVSCTDFGVGMTSEEVADLSAAIDLDELRAYWAAVERRTRSIISDLRPTELDEDNAPAYIERVVNEDGMLREAGRWGEGLWTGMPNRTKGYFLGYLGLTHSWQHLGEALVTGTLLGMPSP